MTERSAAAHRVSNSNNRDAESGLPHDTVDGNGARKQRHAYDPKVKARGSLLWLVLGAVREAGAAKIISGAISLFLLLSVLTAMFGSSGSSSGQQRGVSIHLRARELLPVATPKVPLVKVDKSKFVRRKGTRLLLGGQSFRFSGASNYYMLTRAVEKATRSQVAEVFETAEKLGLKVMRVWAFNDGDAWNALQPRLGQVDERVLIEGLDWVVSQAREFGIKLILTLTSSEADYGGMAQYVKWAAPLTETIRDFYASKTIRRAFKEYVGAVILHKNSVTGVYYRDDPTIMAWELANAPTCPGDDSGNLLQDWIEDMSAHIKSLDPHHLVMLGHSGVFGSSTPERWQYNPPSLDVTTPVVPWTHAYDAVCEGVDWTRNHEAKHIDIAALQVWPDEWLVAPEPWKLHWARQWIRSHIWGAERLQKPLLLSAFAKQRHSQQSTMAARNAFFQTVYQEAERSDAVAGTLFWMLASNSYPDYDGYTVHSSRVALQQPVPPHPALSPEALKAIVERRKFMNWEAMLVCGAKRVMGNTTANQPINPYRPDANAWVDGWADLLDVINSHAQVMAKLGGVQLSKPALSHTIVSRPRMQSSLLPEGAVSALPDIPEWYEPSAKVESKNVDTGGLADDAKHEDAAAAGSNSASEDEKGSGNATGGSSSKHSGREAQSAGSKRQDAGSGSGDVGAGSAATEGHGSASSQPSTAKVHSSGAGDTLAADSSSGANNGTAADAGAQQHASEVHSANVMPARKQQQQQQQERVAAGADRTAAANATEELDFDYDEPQAGGAAVKAGGLLSRLTGSVNGVLGGVFTQTKPALDDDTDELDDAEEAALVQEVEEQEEEAEEDADEEAKAAAEASAGGLSLDEAEDGAEWRTRKAAPGAAGLAAAGDSSRTAEGTAGAVAANVKSDSKADTSSAGSEDSSAEVDGS